MMWGCEPRGHLVLNGKPYSLGQLARAVREAEKPVKAALDELGAAGVYSITAGGVIYSRRMVRDEEKRRKRAEGGEQGGQYGVRGAEFGGLGGRPKKPPSNPPSAKPNDEGESPSNPPPSSSSSSSSSTSVGEDKSSPAGGGGAEAGAVGGLPVWLVNELKRYPSGWGEPFRPVWQGWLEYLAGVLRKAPPFQTVDSHREILSGCGSDVIRIQFVQTAIARGFREPCAPKKTEVHSKQELTDEQRRATWGK
jgi:hypothetical protein